METFWHIHFVLVENKFNIIKIILSLYLFTPFKLDMRFEPLDKIYYIYISIQDGVP